MEYIGQCIMHSSLQAYRHGRGGYGRMDDTNRYDFKGCQDWRWPTFRPDMLRGVGMILSEIQPIAFSPTAFVGVCAYVCLCVCVYVCVCMCMYVFARLNSARKRFEINPPLFHHHVGHIMTYSAML